MEFHAAFVVERTHNLNLLYEALLSLVLTVGRLFRECLDGKVFASLKFLREVNGGEVALSNFLLWLELFVETSLV
jgi:hypothetical protein